MSDGFGGIASGDLDAVIARVAPALAELDRASIFLTGGTGFFGRWLLALLARARTTLPIDLTVTVLSRDPGGFLRASPDLAQLDCVRLIAGDVRSFAFPAGRFTHVIHAATDTSAAADRDPMTLIASITEGTRRVLDFATAAEVGRFLYVSSGAVYGRQPPDLAVIPDDHPGACDPLDPRSAYGQAKRLAEQMCAIVSARTATAAVIARAFAFVGPGLPLDGHFAIGNFIRDALDGRTIVVSGDGQPVRSYLYAADLAGWLTTLLVRGMPGTAYNVGSDQPISIADLAAAVAAEIPSSRGVAIRGLPSAGADRNRYVPSIDKARRDLGLDVWTPLGQAIRRTADAARRTG